MLVWNCCQEYVLHMKTHVHAQDEKQNSNTLIKKDFFSAITG